MKPKLALLLWTNLALAQSSLLGPTIPPLPPKPVPIDPLHQPPQTPKPKAPSLPLKGNFRPNEVLVKFHNASLPIGLVQALGLTKAVGVGGAGWHHLVSSGNSTEGLVRALEVRADVDRVEPNYIMQAASSPCGGSGSMSSPPNDPCWTDGSLWGLSKIQADSVWNSAGTTGSSSIVVGMLDSGIRLTHEDLSANLWSSPSFTVCIGSTASPCPSANTVTCSSGTAGFNAVAFGSGSGSVCDPTDDYSHGTFTAGIVGAKGNNGLGVVGVNQTSALMALKIANSSGSFAASDAVNGIEFAVQMHLNYSTNIRVLNGSFGCRPSTDPSTACTGSSSDFTSLQEEIQRAGSYNMLLAAAAGNNGQSLDCGSASCQYVPAYWSNPSQLTPNIVSVAATTPSDTLASYSSYGSTSVQVAAPGGDNSTNPQNNIWSTLYSGDSSYFFRSGTSFAAPHVSGAAALALANSNCTANTLGLKSAIITNVDVPSPSLSVSSGGRLNAYKTLRGCALQNLTVSPTAGKFSKRDLYVHVYGSAWVLRSRRG